MPSLTSLPVQRPGWCWPLNCLLIAVLYCDWHVGNKRKTWKWCEVRAVSYCSWAVDYLWVKVGAGFKGTELENKSKWIFDSLPGWFTGRISLLWAKSNKKKKRRVEKERMVLPFKEACPQLPAWASETFILCQRAKQLVLGNGNLRFHVLSIRKSSSLLTEGFPVAVTMSLSQL